MKLRNLTILVTGGAGFIGSHTAETLAQHNRVIIFDNLASSVLSLRDLSRLSNVRFIRGDIRKPQDLARAMRGIDIVFHFAVACVRISLSDERHVHDVNSTGTLNTLLAAKKAGVKRFIYISSSEVYGTSGGGRMDENHSITPTTVYGASKYVGELYTKHFNDMEGLPAVIVRPFNTYGPRSHFDGVYGEVIPRFTVLGINGKQPIIFGTGKQTRDFTYISDTVDGIIRAASCDKLAGNVVNIARGEEVTVRQIASTICTITGLPFSPVMMPPRPNDVARHFADIRKAKMQTLFVPRVAINDGLSSYIAWVRKTYPDPSKLLRRIPRTNW
jgi:UDP-glucose 4-epimerase